VLKKRATGINGPARAEAIHGGHPTMLVGGCNATTVLTVMFGAG
jgi:hypothetical protein